MRKFQIKNIDRHGCGSFHYFEVADSLKDEEIIETACKIATEWRSNRLSYHSNSISIFGAPEDLFKRKLYVVEYVSPKRVDGKLVKHGYTKRGGFKFYLKLWGAEYVKY